MALKELLCALSHPVAQHRLCGNKTSLLFIRHRPGGKAYNLTHTLGPTDTLSRDRGWREHLCTLLLYLERSLSTHLAECQMGKELRELKGIMEHHQVDQHSHYTCPRRRTERKAEETYLKKQWLQTS